MRPECGRTRFPSITDVAKRADVSLSTASRVLRGRGYASGDARMRVLQAAEELGYEPNLAARSLKLRSSTLIGLIIQDITNPFYAFVAKGIADATRNAGFALLLSDSQEDRDREAESLRVMLRTRVAGVIITPTVGNGEILGLLQRRSIAVVQVDRTIPKVKTDCVLIDNLAGAYAGTAHLIELGHREIGVVAGPRSLTTGRLRLRGFKTAMKDHGLHALERHVKVSDFRRETGTALADRLLDERPRPTAIFAHNNILAESVLSVLRKRGLRVPNDIAVVAFDDPPWARLASPPLTVIRQPAYTIGATAAELLVRHLTNSRLHPAPETVMLEPTLVVRGSCGGVSGNDTSEEDEELVAHRS